VHAMIRRYRLDRGEIDEIAHRVDMEFAETLSAEAGFVHYQVVDCGDGTLVSISIEPADALAHVQRARVGARLDRRARWVGGDLTRRLQRVTSMTRSWPAFAAMPSRYVLT
jgi:hypothetical protein